MNYTKRELRMLVTWAVTSLAILLILLSSCTMVAPDTTPEVELPEFKKIAVRKSWFSLYRVVDWEYGVVCYSIDGQGGLACLLLEDLQ